MTKPYGPKKKPKQAEPLGPVKTGVITGICLSFNFNVNTQHILLKTDDGQLKLCTQNQPKFNINDNIGIILLFESARALAIPMEVSYAESSGDHCSFTSVKFGGYTFKFLEDSPVQVAYDFQVSGIKKLTGRLMAKDYITSRGELSVSYFAICILTNQNQLRLAIIPRCFGDENSYIELFLKLAGVTDAKIEIENMRYGRLNLVEDSSPYVGNFVQFDSFSVEIEGTKFEYADKKYWTAPEVVIAGKKITLSDRINYYKEVNSDKNGGPHAYTLTLLRSPK